MSRAETNRANAQLSTGPKTAEGKQRSKFNARRHNLTGQIVLGTEDEQLAYAGACARLIADLRPEGEFEKRLTQSLADAQWQLERARAIETNLFFELASQRLAENEGGSDADVDAAGFALAQAGAFLDHARQFDLISRYATRYHRQVLQLHATLMKVQAERRAYDQKRNQQRHERHTNQSPKSQNGFVSHSPAEPRNSSPQLAPQAPRPDEKRTSEDKKQAA